MAQNPVQGGSYRLRMITDRRGLMVTRSLALLGTVVAAIAAGVAAGAPAVPPAAAQGSPADAPMLVGTVDLEQCFDKDKYPYVRDVNADREKVRAEMSAEVKGLEAELARLEDQIKGLDKKTNLYQEKVRQYKLTEAKLDATAKFSQAQLRAKKIMLWNEVYNEIRRVVTLVASEGKYDIVMRVEEPQLDDDSPEMAIQRINYRVVLYAGDRFDITKKVIERLNQEYAKKKGGGSAPSPSPK